VVVWQARHARAELDVAGAVDRLGDRELRRGDDLHSSGMMLADPRLVKAEPVEPLDQFEVAAPSPASGSRRAGGNGQGRCRSSSRGAPSLYPCWGHAFILYRSTIERTRLSNHDPRSRDHHLQPGKRDEVLAAFRANMPAVHAEAAASSTAR